MKTGEYFQTYSSQRDLKERLKTPQKRTRPRTTSMPPELERWATKPRTASQVENDRLLFISPVRDFTERAVDCDGLEEKNTKKTGKAEISSRGGGITGARLTDAPSSIPLRFRPPSLSLSPHLPHVSGARQQQLFHVRPFSGQHYAFSFYSIVACRT